MKAKGSGQDTQSSRALRTLAWAIGAGVAVVVVYGFQVATRSEYFSVVSVGLVIAGASVLLGAVLGSGYSTNSIAPFA